MSDAVKGVLAMIAACVTWGLSGIYYAMLNHIPALEVLAHRTIWSCLFFLIVILVTGRTNTVREAVRAPRTMGLLFVTALLISTNWFGFIFAIQNGHAMEASLGYYIFPLVAVAIGYVMLGERFGRAQAIAIGLAGLAVLILTLGLGVPPWIALILSGTFGFYGLIKKQLEVGPVTSTFLEVSLILPIALIYLGGDVFAHSLRDMLLLMASGALTGGPLIGFAYAARRLNFATLGLVQYVNPTLQFSVAVFLFGEAFTRWHAVAFPLIWGALALYSFAVWRQDRAARKTSMA